MAGEPASSTFRVEVGGASLPVTRYEDLDCVHFPFTGPAEVVIARLDGQPVGAHRIRPERLGYRGTVAGAALSFQLDRPRTLIVNIDKLRKLLLIAEPPASGKPQAGTPGVVDLLSLGADPTGVSDNTATIQKAIDALPKGGTLYVPPGRYLTGSLQLKSDMTLYLDQGAMLKGSADPDLHRMQKSYLYFLRGEDLVNVRIAGPGIIDANGGAIRKAWEAKLGQRKVPGRAVLFVKVRGLEIRDVTIRDSYSWNVHIVESDRVVIDNVKVLSNLAHGNGDGLDIDGCVDVKIANCFLYCEDDAISPKASWSNRTPENYRVRDCVLWSQNATAIRLGDETNAPAFRDMTFENIDCLRAQTMLRIYNYDGADLHHIVFRNFWLEEYSLDVQDLGYEESPGTNPANEGTTSLLHIYVKKRSEKSKLGAVHDVLLENIHSQSLAKSRLSGTPREDGTKGIRKVTFKEFWEGERSLRSLEEIRVKLGDDSAEIGVTE